MLFDIILRLIVNTVRKTAVAKASWLMLSIPFAELLDLRRPVPGSSHFWNTKQILNSILNNT